MEPPLEREQWGKAGKIGMRDCRFLIQKNLDQRGRIFIITLIKIVTGKSVLI